MGSIAERQKVERGLLKYSESEAFASAADGLPHVALSVSGLRGMITGNCPVRSSSSSANVPPWTPKSRVSCLALTYWPSRLMSQWGVGLNLKLTDWSWT